MKKRNRIYSALVLLSLLVTMTGCGSAETGEIQNRGTETESLATEKAPVTESVEEVTDDGEETIQFACPSISGQLQVKDGQLCDEKGNPVQLRGISTHGIAWFPSYVNKDAFGEFRKDWGANVVRLAMYTHENGGYCTDGDQKSLLETLENGVEYAKDNDLYVIIDWHVLNEGSPLLYQDQALSFWKEISAKYADYDNVIYEICNEPCNGTSWSEVKEYANSIIPEIRKNDSDAVILVGTPNWSQDVDLAADDPLTGYENIMYTLHFYAATHKRDLQNKLESAVEKGLPVFVSEYGICDASGNGSLDEESANTWISLLDKLGISYVCWNLSNKEESSALISSSCNKTSGFTADDLSGEGKWLYQMLTEKAESENAGKATFLTDEEGKDSSNSDGESSDTESSSSIGDSEDTLTISSGNLKIKARLENSWDGDGGTCYQYTCQIENTSDADVNSWKFTLTFDKEISLSDGWNGIYTVKGKKLTISNADYNGSIKAGGSISDIGFIVCGGSLE